MVALREVTGSLHLALPRLPRSAKERYQKSAGGKGSEKHRLQVEFPGREVQPGGSVASRSGTEAERGIGVGRGTAAVEMNLSG